MSVYVLDSPTIPSPVLSIDFRAEKAYPTCVVNSQAYSILCLKKRANFGKQAVVSTCMDQF